MNHHALIEEQAMKERLWRFMWICAGRGGRCHDAVVTQSINCPVCLLMNMVEDYKEFAEEMVETINGYAERHRLELLRDKWEEGK
jgi:hypothetical protein